MSYYLLLLAVAPAAALLYYVWKKDKSKEPPKMLFTLLGLGAVSVIPVLLLELLNGKIVELVAGNNNFLSAFGNAFFVAALVEEGFKFLFLYFYTHNHKEFDSFFDGMIYAIFIGLGFALVENIEYVVLDENPIRTALMRAVMSVPGHMFFAVFMGYYYSLWHVNKLCADSEDYFANLHMIQKREPAYNYNKYLALAFVVPFAVHGFYDFCLFMSNWILTVVCLLFVVALYIICFSRIKTHSDNDMEDYKLIPLMLCKKYPELIGIIIPRQANPMSVSQVQYQQLSARPRTQRPPVYALPQSQRQPTYIQQPQQSYYNRQPVNNSQLYNKPTQPQQIPVAPQPQRPTPSYRENKAQGS